MFENSTMASLVELLLDFTDQIDPFRPRNPVLEVRRYVTPCSTPR